MLLHLLINDLVFGFDLSEELTTLEYSLLDLLRRETVEVRTKHPVSSRYIQLDCLLLELDLRQGVHKFVRLGLVCVVFDLDYGILHSLDTVQIP